MSEVHIVKLKPEEWQLYKQIRLEALQNDPQSFVPTYVESLQQPDAFWQGRLQSAWEGEDTWLLFAREGERLVGSIGAFRRDAGPEVVIVAVYVSPDRRGRGIGRLLMAAIIEAIGRPEGVDKLALSVTSTQAAAQALYRSFGFRQVGEKHGLMGDGEMHTGYLMERPFAAG